MIGENLMKIAIVLAMHGAPPLDFLKEELSEFFGLHNRVGHGSSSVSPQLKKRYEELNEKILRWPRSRENDPFYSGTMDMAENLKIVSGYEVIVGFNEFCAPTIKEAIETAQNQKPEKIIVITPMMTRGGEHSERDIPKAIKDAQKMNPDIPIEYAWPFAISDVASFLFSHIKRFI
jgi:sirohydrochlorin cobaltochelatase